MDTGVNKNSSYLSELNDIQREAVTAGTGPVMVIAGPGSGKTRVLTYRIAHLIESGVAPWNILALTFTNKAAREMKERIEKVVGPRANKVWAGTFHSIFARLLRSEAHRIGYPNDFTIYDSDDSKSVIREILKTMGLDPKVYNPNAVLSRISNAKSNLITPKLYSANEDLMANDRINRRPMMQAVYGMYSAKLMRAGAMDFDDLLLQMFRLLYENPDNIKEKYQSTFQYVLVDEFQDTNYLQYQIIKQFIMYEGSTHNVNIVGDDAQSIYSFRGATIENILQFEKDFPNVKTCKLEQNYRSTKHIVQAANDVISYNKKQIQKKIWTSDDHGQKIKIEKCLSDGEEGRKIASLIIEHKTRYHVKNKDIAILYRTNAQSRVFEEHLRRQNIPYKIIGGMSFYQRKEVKDIIAYLRLTVNSRDDEALKRVINYPKRGIGATTITKISQIAADQGISMWEAIGQMQLSPRSMKKLVDFGRMIELFRQKALEEDAYQVASYIAKKTGIIELLKEDVTPEGIARVDNVTALLDGIKEFIEDDTIEEGEVASGKSISEYLQNIALLTDQDKEETNPDYVTLMSVHAAKGLEFVSVFVVGLEENLFPSFMSMSDPRQLDEERRLFYVAITRAEKYLTLSFAQSRYHYGNMRFNDPSRFIEEIDPEHIDSIVTMSSGQSSGSKSGASIQGNFKKATNTPVFSMDISNFKPSPKELIKTGMRVAHIKFGEGQVMKIEGAKDNPVATIRFENIDNPERRIMLKFAKLMIVN